MSAHRSASYRAAGVDYEALDAAKRVAMNAALQTSALMGGRGANALDDSRGEPAFVFELGGQTLAFVLEGLGTKSIIAREVLELEGTDRFADVAYDAVAAIVNDLCCVGALPLVTNAYFATGSSDWYRDGERAGELVRGWQRACEEAGCAWGGGESPSLSGLVAHDDIELAGAAVGVVPPGRAPLLGGDLAAGDEIVLAASSGLHANGASLARLVAARLPAGFATRLASGHAFGAALLAPSIIYVPLVAAVLASDVQLTYLSHITGHGLLKLMRAEAELSYRVQRLPPVPEVLEFLATEARLDQRAAYSTLNMGSGMAIYCRAGGGDEVVRLAAACGIPALVAGHVAAGPREVVLEPLSVRFAAEQLDLAPSRRDARSSAY
ncbi:MAG TPA: AIR synthase related protein [Solirubrobacteraceae bacterium]|jgi:phosphoribosylformylglycinamidine cyclo-ligase|nr:AIR synthase related protein [Solirubrobacteraceae bacterium]